MKPPANFSYTVKSKGVDKVKNREKFKVLVVGNAKCGKTSIIARYVKGTFDPEYKTTVGADYAQKVLDIGQGKELRLQLWDIAGQDRFANLTRVYYNNAVAALVVCDVTRMATLDACRAWKAELDEKLNDYDKEVPVILLANKCDLLKGGAEAFSAGLKMQRMATDAGFKGCYIASAKEDENLQEAMWYLVENILDGIAAESQPIEKKRSSKVIKLTAGPRGGPSKASCC